MVNIGDPAQAFSVAQLPYLSGVGLARLEFIIASTIKIHPLACLDDKNYLISACKKKLDALCCSIYFKKRFFC